MTEAIFNAEEVLTVDRAMIDELKRRASESPRKRFRLCMHWDHTALTQEMLIVLARDAYPAPHRHPEGKTESYHIIEGAMQVFLFNDDGSVMKSFTMDAAGRSDAPIIYRLSSSLWHVPVILSEYAVYHEIYTGPFDKASDVEIAPWGPGEFDTEGLRKFHERLRRA